LEAEAAGLAMLALFGCPHLDRVPVHQLHPSGVHAAGHGRHYGVALAAAAEAVLAL
jgi:fructosamine-3-kinase